MTSITINVFRISDGVYRADGSVILPDGSIHQISGEGHSHAVAARSAFSAAYNVMVGGDR